jgi:elongation factor Ts
MNTELIKELRARTSAGMADCKAALVEAEWDIDKAQDLVKARGLAQTARNASKVASEGRVSLYGNTLVEVNSNTDFTAGSPDFIAFAELAAKTLGEADLAAFSGDLNTLSVSGKSLEEHRQEVAGKTKENIVLRRWMREEVSGDNRTVFSYVHSNNKLGVLLSMEAPTKEDLDNDEFRDFGNNLAMQIAAMNPLAVSSDKLSQADRDRQQAIFETQLKEQGKPEASWGKIIEGKNRKWYSEICLLDQESVFCSKTSVKQLVDQLSLKLGGPVKILNFMRMVVGEGIEKEPQDLAADVAQMIENQS